MPGLSIPSPPDAVPGDVTGVLRALLDDDPGGPRLTWYGPGGERVELSSRVLDNWVAKTANLLTVEFDAGPATRVAIALPAHWRTATWLLATWSTGACAVPVPVGGPVPPDVDVLVACDPRVLGEAPEGALPIGVALGALATSFGPGLPDGAVDAAVDVRSHGDVFLPFVTPGTDDPALDDGGNLLTHGDLIPAARRAADETGLPPRARLLAGGGPGAAVTELLAPLARLGSVVLIHDLDRADPSALARLRAQENVTTPPA